MILHYLRISLRSLWRKKTYSITTLTGLSIGMASCLLILIFVVDELSYDRYHNKKDRIYRLATQIPASSYEGVAKVTGPWGPAAQSEIPDIENMTRFVMSGMSGQLLIGRNEQRFYEPNGFYTDASVFKIFDYEWIEGDPESALTQPNTMVVTRSFAKRYFGKENALGETLRIDNERDFKITGVIEDVPSNSHFTFTYLLSMSSLQHPQRDSWTQWNQFYTYLLLRENTNPEKVAEKIKPILARNMGADAANYIPFLQPLTSIHLYSHLHREMVTNSDVSYIYIFSSIAILILSISCANFINMTTAQATVRAKEIGVRKVNGAVRKQLVTQFMIEVVLICLLAAVFAESLTVLALPVLNELTGKTLDPSVLLKPVFVAGVFGVACFTALLAGSYPALYQASLKPMQVLKGRWTPSGNNGLRKSLVVFQFSLSSVLVIASLIIFQQLHFIQSKSLGFDPEQIITLPIQADALRTQFETMKAELLKHPGVVNVSLSGSIPGGSDWGIPCVPEGFTSENAPPFRVMAVDHDFIKTYGITIAEGRDFSKELASDSTTYLINEEAARQLGWTEPLKKTISMPVIGRTPGDVIGVVKDFHFHSMREKIGGLLFFVPPPGWHSIYSIKIDTRRSEEVLAHIEKQWAVFDPGHPFSYSFFDEGYNSLYQREQHLSQIIGYFTAIGIFLACLGLYSLASYTAEQRTKEIGIRKVIGASAQQIVLMLSKQYLLLVVIGFALAVPVAWYVLQQWLQSFAYHVEFNALLIFCCGILSALVALLTVGYKALRAATANPVDSLRNE
jgi:putative ABC transport system permease protein